jgi:mRNA (guanine-N7-)-methyltransferase
MYTGVQLKEGFSLKNIIIDGEYITKDKNSTPISRFMAFDMYFNSFSDVRQLPFIPTENKNGRYPLLQTFIGIINSIIQDEITNLPTNACSFGVKQFILIDDKSPDYEFHTSCRRVLEMDHIYNVDGLIFTPSYLAVGAETHSPFVAGPLTKIRWASSFKWKPPQYNTNDFLATTLKADDKTNTDKITNMMEPNTTAGEPIQMMQYKTLELRCGFSQRNSGYLDAFSRILTKQRMRAYRDEYSNANQYTPTLFYPTDYPDKYAHICNVILKPDENGIMQMFTEEGEVFDDDTIVEFRYEHRNEDGFKWVPLRVRNDKTHEYRKGLKSYGNDYETANNNWKSIMNPITEEMLITGQLPPYEDVIAKGDAYYTKSTAGERDILQKFHNYVKEDLIVSNTMRGQTLIDLASGKAGDLWKWEKAGVSFVFGVDYSRDNIENRFDGAAARYMNYYMERGETFRCIFVTGDSSKNIRNGEALLNERNKAVSDAVLGIGGGARDSVIGDLYGIGANGFDVCSCQFAIHYFFKNTTTLQGFMTNVCQNVKVGGVFIGTCYDGKALFNRFKSSGVDEIVIHSGRTLYWKCTKKYTETEFEDDSSSLGYSIDVYQKSIGSIHTEYLVNFDYLVRVMDNYGFKVVSITSFKDIYEGLNKPNAEKYRDLGRMEENLITFLNNTFVFQKIRDVDATLVELDATPIIERKEREIEEPIIAEPEAAPAPAPVPAPAPAPTKQKKTRKCKENEELVDDRCLKKCGEDEIRNPVTKRCNKTKKNK